MIRLLLNADVPLATAAVTRFGGRPLIPQDAGFQWPCCASCGGLMQFLGQIALDDRDVKRLALVFMCQDDPGMCDEWDASSGGNRVIVVAAADDAWQLAELPEGDSLVRDTVYGARLEDVDSGGYDDASQQWAQKNHCSPRQILGQLEGEPSWIQPDETPTCDLCGNNMKFIAQLEQGPDHRTEMNFGGGGSAYVFRCSCIQHTAKFLWQC
ncbi:DUF1963 domain-containing protein [Pseudomonas fluorescens]|uniref:DUF1963 domain-containing protein n=1 Tax=Pseudomonas fluorescens TaxID=294 RepID=A0A5E7P483_PSEFL|nr:DUF1963 domain-containing protein [Pseudomonas fluorescens]VVP44542.1 hypothetical protein PS880_05025 [Pseudomonas fluorescens]